MGAVFASCEKPSLSLIIYVNPPVRAVYLPLKVTGALIINYMLINVQSKG